MKIDIEHFKNTLYKEAAELFPQIIEQYKKEGIYSLAFYTSGDSWSYLLPTHATYAGLETAVASYQRSDYGKATTTEDITADLKWSPCDSPYHCEFEDAFPKTQALLDTLSEDLYMLYEEECDAVDDEEDEDHTESDALRVLMLNACLDTLIKLDEDGVFSDLERDNLVLNVLNGDQSYEERMERAAKVNPPSAFKTYQQDMQSLIAEGERLKAEALAMLEKLSKTEH